MSTQISRPGIQHACVVYDAETGDICHVHQVAVLPGAESPTKHDIEERAMALAKRFVQRDPSRLKVLHIAPESLKPRMIHRVNLKSLTLISEPIPHRGKGPKPRNRAKGSKPRSRAKRPKPRSPA